MKKTLPKRPDLDHLRKQAKALLSRLKRGDGSAARVFIEHLPGASKLTPSQVEAKGYRLADAQSAIARKTGFASWPSLSKHVAELKKLEGDWRFRTLEVDGAKVPAAMIAHSRILIDGDRFRTESPEGNYEGVFVIDVDAGPHAIDIEFVEGPEEGNVCFGIYKLEHASVTFCLGLVGSTRPEGFVSRPGSGHALETLKRVSSKRPEKVDGGIRKPKAEGASAVASPPAVDAAGFDVVKSALLRKLQGEWSAVELIQNGEATRADWLPFGSRIVSGNETKVVFGGQTMVHAKMRFDETVRPVAVDYLNLTGRSKGKLSLGVVDWTGDEVRFNIASAGDPRPTEFTSARGGGTTLSRWRKK